MRIAVLFGPLCLSFRGSFDFDNIRTDPRGLTGSEIGFIRIAECLQELGHEVSLYTTAAQKEWKGMPVRPWDSDKQPCDAAIAINEPDLLRDFGGKARVRVCESWLNDWTFCFPDFDKHVDRFISPSEPHLEQVLNNPDWRHVHVTADTPRGHHMFTPDPAKWQVIPLGCDPFRYEAGMATRPGEGRTPAHEGRPVKIRGRVVYCSSPDRGLHWLLQEWPKIKVAVPHATLHIFYRLRDWVKTFDNTPYFPPIEKLRARALYIAEALRRLEGMDVTVRDSVSRETIEREMAQAEVLAYPCDTTSWSEGFSCTVLEACAARACPIITDCDALGGIYRGHTVVMPLADISAWSDMVIQALRDEGFRGMINAEARAFAEETTWKKHTESLVKTIETALSVAHHPV